MYYHSQKTGELITATVFGSKSAKGCKNVVRRWRSPPIIFIYFFFFLQRDIFYSNAWC